MAQVEYKTDGYFVLYLKTVSSLKCHDARYSLYIVYFIDYDWAMYRS